MGAEMIILKFDDTYGAQQALAAVRALEELDYLWMEDLAVIERHRSGRIATHTTHGSVAEGSAWGGLTGGLIGLLFGPAGFLAGVLIGGGAGAAIEKAAKESGMPTEVLDEIRRELEKGTSVLVLIGATGDIDEMAHAFEAHHPTKTLRYELDEGTVDRIRGTVTG